MTNKRRFPRPFTAAILLVCLAASMPFAGSAQAYVNRYWTDPASGIAIAGYDPVAYFVQGKPVKGNAAHEYVWRGVIWRFASAANCAAFIEAPEVYAPQFGGYSVVGVARGFPSEGSPVVWVIADNRLYLFHSPTHKAVWQQDPGHWTEQAIAKWPALERRLIP